MTAREETSEFYDLGLVTSNKLSWNAHVYKMSSEANEILSLIKRTCKGLKDVDILRPLHCASVRSQLECCTIVWLPFTARNINKLERIQRTASKFILKLTRTMKLALNYQRDQLPVGLIAQLIEYCRALHRYRGDHGYESRSGLNCF